jgi:hypothetical protein
LIQTSLPINLVIHLHLRLRINQVNLVLTQSTLNRRLRLLLIVQHLMSREIQSQAELGILVQD